MWRRLVSWWRGLPTVPYIDADGWIRAGSVRRYPSARGALLRTPHSAPLAIVWHYTATDPGTAKSLARRIVALPTASQRAVSWHLLIAVDGTIYQSLPLTWAGWHCSAGKIDGYRVNRCTVGIELEGHGDRIPPAQVESARQCMNMIHWRYRIPRARLALGHVDFDPKRRADPGPLWAATLARMADSVAPLHSV